MKLAAVSIACSLCFVAQSTLANEHSLFDNGDSWLDRLAVYSIFDDRDVWNAIEIIENKIYEEADPTDTDDVLKKRIHAAVSKYFYQHHFDFMSGLYDTTDSFEEFDHVPFDKYSYNIHPRLDKSFVNAFIHENQHRFQELNLGLAPHAHSADDDHIHSIMDHINHAIRNSHHYHDDLDEDEGSCSGQMLFEMFDANNDRDLSEEEYHKMEHVIDDYDDDTWDYDYSYDGVDYDGEAFWSFNNDFCDCYLNPKQSPIDINTSDINIMNTTVGLSKSGEAGWVWYIHEFNFSASSPFKWNVSFNSHNTWTIVPVKGVSTAFAKKVSSFYHTDYGEFILSHIDVHYGRNNDEGSEHLIDGKAFPLEMQYVFFRANYDNYNDAVEKGKRAYELERPESKYRTITIVSVMFEVSDDEHYNNRAMKNVFNVQGQEPETIAFSPTEINPTNSENPNKTVNAYTYPGSLTTPDCLPIVNWVIMKDTMVIGQENMEKLHAFTNNGRNFRSVQTSFDGVVSDFSNTEHEGVHYFYDIQATEA